MEKQIGDHKIKRLICSVSGIIVLLFVMLMTNTTIYGRAQMTSIDVDELRTGNNSNGNQLVDYYGTILNADMGIEFAKTIEQKDENQDVVIIKKMKGIDLYMSVERSLNFLIENQNGIKEKKEQGDFSDQILYVGAKVKYDRTKVPGNRVESMKIKNTNIIKDNYYKVAMSQTLGKSENYPEIRDSKEEKNISMLFVKDAIKMVSTQIATSKQEKSRYELIKPVEKETRPNITLMLLSSGVAIGLGILGGWIFTRNKQKNNL